jgi:hypothetical protein
MKLLVSALLFSTLVSAQSLESTRKLCKGLTDTDITRAGKYPYPKRKKAFKRHVKQLCEKIELKHWLNQPLQAEEYAAIDTLKLMKASMYDKAKEDATGMTILDKIKMGINSVVTPFILRERIGSSNLMDPVNSIFWSKPGSKPYKRFGKLADKKKIDADEHMVMIFDGVSDGGSAPKIKAIDLNLDDEWSLKWGDELHTDVVGSRLFAALGFDVDHPYYRKKDDITLVFPKNEEIALNPKEMLHRVKKQFNIDVKRFVSHTGVIDEVEINAYPELKPFIGLPYMRFKECAIEGRPDRVKRLGSIVPSKLGNENRKELRGALLAHLWIDNWDTRKENTLLTNNHLGKKRYRISGAFSDLGTSLGVKINYLPVDFRVGLVNEFPWDIIKKKTGKKIVFNGQLNAYLKPYRKATYSDLRWMAAQIARIDKKTLEKILDKSGWPRGIKKLYFHKLASRRDQILKAFEIRDPNPIKYNRKLNYSKNGVVFIKNGVLIRDYNKNKHPLGYLGTQGRFRNYGGNK